MRGHFYKIMGFVACTLCLFFLSSASALEPGNNLSYSVALPEDSPLGEASIREHAVAWHQNYWYYTRSLTYRFPLKLGANKARRIAVLETPVGPKPRKYFASADGERWEEITHPARDQEFTHFPIPAACLDKGVVYIRLEQCAVSGFALAT